MGLLNGLLSYYKLDEASGNALDSHDSSPLTPAVGPASNTGILNGCRTCAGGGSGDAFEGNVSGLNAQSAFSVAGWINVTDTPDLILIFEAAFGAARLFWDGGGSGHFIFRSGGVDMIIDGSLSASTWTFMAITSDGSTTVGLRVNSTDYSGSWNDAGSSSNDFALGGTSDPVDTSFDEVGIWSRALSVAELDSLYGSGTPPGYDSFTLDTLSFNVQPSNAAASANISPNVQVTSTDGSFTGAVTLSINSNPGGSTLTTDTNPLNATAGVATFTHTSLNNAGTGYTLDASASGYATVTSNSFDITGASFQVGCVKATHGVSGSGVF